MDEYIEKNQKFTSKILFYTAYTILMFKTICGRLDFVQNVGEYMTIIELLLLTVCILIQTRYYKVKTIIFMFAILLICLYSYVITRNANIMILFFFIFAMKNIDFEKLLKYDIKMKIMLLLLNIVFISLGLLENIITYRDNGSIRQTLGFASPNSFGGLVMSICFEWVYLRRKNINGLTYLILILTTIGLEFLCNSRTPEICIILLIVVIFVYKRKIYLKKVLPYLPIVLTIISLFLVYLYGKQNPIALRLDNILTTRLLCAYNFFQLYDINLFGNMFTSTGIWLGYVNTLDNAYLYLLLNQGIVLYIFVIFVNIALFKNAIKDNDRILAAILMVYCFYAFMERGTYFVTFNIFLLYTKDIFFKKQEQIIKESKNERINKCDNTSI